MGAQTLTTRPWFTGSRSSSSSSLALAEGHGGQAHLESCKNSCKEGRQAQDFAPQPSARHHAPLPSRAPADLTLALQVLLDARSRPLSHKRIPLWRRRFRFPRMTRSSAAGRTQLWTTFPHTGRGHCGPAPRQLRKALGPQLNPSPQVSPGSGATPAP